MGSLRAATSPQKPPPPKKIIKKIFGPNQVFWRGTFRKKIGFWGELKIKLFDLLAIKAKTKCRESINCTSAKNRQKCSERSAAVDRVTPSCSKATDAKRRATRTMATSPIKSAALCRRRSGNCKRRDRPRRRSAFWIYKTRRNSATRFARTKRTFEKRKRGRMRWTPTTRAVRFWGWGAQAGGRVRSGRRKSARIRTGRRRPSTTSQRSSMARSTTDSVSKMKRARSVVTRFALDRPSQRRRVVTCFTGGVLNESDERGLDRTPMCRSGVRTADRPSRRVRVGRICRTEDMATR